jgi:two-component system, NtrC family, sensor kinase
MNKFRWSNLALAAALIALLGFLIVKTRSVDFDGHNEIVSMLRQIKQLDAEWNVDVLRSKTGFNSNYDPVVSPLPLMDSLEGALRTKTDELFGTGGSGDAGLLAQLDGYRKAMDEKINSIERFKSQNSILRNSSRYLPVAANEMMESLRTENVDAATRGQVEEALNRVLADTMAYGLSSDAAAKTKIEQSIESLTRNAAKFSPEMRERITGFATHVGTIVKQQEIGDRVLGQIAALPTAKKIDELSDVYQKEHDNRLQQQQIYRNLLIAYSILMLLLLAYLGWRLLKSYRLLNSSNKDLEHANRELKESQVYMVQAEKMSALGQMVAGIAHEINTPLAYVKGTIEVLKDQMTPINELASTSYSFTKLVRDPNKDRSELSRTFETVSELSKDVSETNVIGEMNSLMKDGLHGIEQISEIVQNLKNFSRLDRAKIDDFSVNEGLESTLLLAKNLLKSAVDIEKDYGAVPKVKCSPSQINQVFLNIITNAVHAMPAGRAERGKITLRTSLEGKDQVRVEIGDNGSGIPADVLPKIFDPFFTTKEIGKGTGMGLSISYKIVQEHGGKILVDTEEGLGTVFSILLPIQTVERKQGAILEDEEGYADDKNLQFAA